MKIEYAASRPARGCPFCADARLNQMLLDGPEQRVRSKRSTDTQSAYAEKLPVARPLIYLSSELEDATLHERDPDCSIAASQCLQAAGLYRGRRGS